LDKIDKTSMGAKTKGGSTEQKSTKSGDKQGGSTEQKSTKTKGGSTEQKSTKSGDKQGGSTEQESTGQAYIDANLYANLSLGAQILGGAIAIAGGVKYIKYLSSDNDRNLSIDKVMKLLENIQANKAMQGDQVTKYLLDELQLFQHYYDQLGNDYDQLGNVSDNLMMVLKVAARQQLKKLSDKLKQMKDGIPEKRLAYQLQMQTLKLREDTMKEAYNMVKSTEDRGSKMKDLEMAGVLWDQARRYGHLKIADLLYARKNDDVMLTGKQERQQVRKLTADTIKHFSPEDKQMYRERLREIRYLEDEIEKDKEILKQLEANREQLFADLQTMPKKDYSTGNNKRIRDTQKRLVRVSNDETEKAAQTLEQKKKLLKEKSLKHRDERYSTTKKYEALAEKRLAEKRRQKVEAQLRQQNEAQLQSKSAKRRPGK